MTRRRPRAFSLLALLLAAACQSPDPEACDKISKACHELDEGPGSGKPHECHRIAHTDDAERCTSSRDDCVGFCRAAAASAGQSDGGARKDAQAPAAPDAATPDGPAENPRPDAAADAAPAPAAPADAAPPAPDAAPDGMPVSAACVQYCACITKQCASHADAPPWVKTAALCPERCQMFSAAELMCWSGFCNPTAPSLSHHACSHGWGAEGTAECN